MILLALSPVRRHRAAFRVSNGRQAHHGGDSKAKEYLPRSSRHTRGAATDGMIPIDIPKRVKESTPHFSRVAAGNGRAIDMLLVECTGVKRKFRKSLVSRYRDCRMYLSHSRVATQSSYSTSRSSDDCARTFFHVIAGRN
jgi:hypothetical protein